MAALAMWFQDATTTGSVFTPGQVNALLVILGVIAFGMLVQAIVYIAGGLIALKAVKDVKGAIDEVRRDLRTSADEIKGKLYPLIDGVTHVSKKAEGAIETAEGILADATPKIKIITEHLAETSRVVRDSAEKLAQTVGDYNAKTQRQVARVDGMVTAALNTTADVVHAVEHGIKVPAQKIAVAATEARFVAEGLLDKLRGMAAGLPFMPRKGEKIPASPAGYRAPVQRPATRPVTTQPPAATGAVPLVK